MKVTVVIGNETRIFQTSLDFEIELSPIEVCDTGFLLEELEFWAQGLLVAWQYGCMVLLYGCMVVVWLVAGLLVVCKLHNPK